MNFKTSRRLIIEDLSALTQPTVKNFIRYVVFNAGYKVLFWHRILAYMKGKLWLKPIYCLIYIYYKHISYLTGIQIPTSATIGGYTLRPLLLHCDKRKCCVW